MYAQKHRLEISRQRFRGGTVLRAESFSIKAAPSSSPHNRFAIIISKAAVKKAAQRNFWKRLMADGVQKWPNVKKDFLIIVSPKINSATSEDIRRELQEIGERIK